MFKYALCNKPHNILETNSLYIFINKTATKKVKYSVLNHVYTV